jgi:hypothetical protein
MLTDAVEPRACLQGHVLFHLYLRSMPSSLPRDVWVHLVERGHVASRRSTMSALDANTLTADAAEAKLLFSQFTLLLPALPPGVTLLDSAHAFGVSELRMSPAVSMSRPSSSDPLSFRFDSLYHQSRIVYRDRSTGLPDSIRLLEDWLRTNHDPVPTDLVRRVLSQAVNSCDRVALEALLWLLHRYATPEQRVESVIGTVTVCSALKSADEIQHAIATALDAREGGLPFPIADFRAFVQLTYRREITQAAKLRRQWQVVRLLDDFVRAPEFPTAWRRQELFPGETVDVSIARVPQTLPQHASTEFDASGGAAAAPHGFNLQTVEALFADMHSPDAGALATEVRAESEIEQLCVLEANALMALARAYQRSPLFSAVLPGEAVTPIGKNHRARFFAALPVPLRVSFMPPSSFKNNVSLSWWQWLIKHLHAADSRLMVQAIDRVWSHLHWQHFILADPRVNFYLLSAARAAVFGSHVAMHKIFRMLVPAYRQGRHVNVARLALLECMQGLAAPLMLQQYYPHVAHAMRRGTHALTALPFSQAASVAVPLVVSRVGLIAPLLRILQAQATLSWPPVKLEEFMSAAVTVAHNFDDMTRSQAVQVESSPLSSKLVLW